MEHLIINKYNNTLVRVTAEKGYNLFYIPTNSIISEAIISMNEINTVKAIPISNIKLIVVFS